MCALCCVCLCVLMCVWIARGRHGPSAGRGGVCVMRGTIQSWRRATVCGGLLIFLWAAGGTERAGQRCRPGRESDMRAFIVVFVFLREEDPTLKTLHTRTVRVATAPVPRLAALRRSLCRLSKPHDVILPLVLRLPKRERHVLILNHVFDLPLHRQDEERDEV